jgi:hypothetical protein
MMSKDCVLNFKRNGRVAAVASIFRDLESLEAEVMMEDALQLKTYVACQSVFWGAATWKAFLTSCCEKQITC